LDISTLKATLHTSFLGKNLVHIKETASTNDTVRALAEKGAPEGLVIVADVQTGGKGRLGRKWESPEGGLWFSFLLRPSMPPRVAPVLTLMAGVAVAKTMQAHYKLDAKVKWPNDILIGGRKVCGILSEASAQGERLDYVIIGIGINANNEGAALRLERPISPPVSMKDVIGKGVDTTALLASLLRILEREYVLVREGRVEEMLAGWVALSDTIGRKVEMLDAEKPITGIAKGITTEGALLVETESGTMAVASGDCRYL
jgi:BirA family biotin operon repressor/biotin-[acetyl-CoA-carboxylase] ligase